MSGKTDDTVLNPYATAGAVLNPEKAGWFWQLPGVTPFGKALLACKNKLNRAWEIKNGHYTGMVKVLYQGKTYMRTRNELLNHLKSIKAM